MSTPQKARAPDSVTLFKAGCPPILRLQALLDGSACCEGQARRLCSLSCLDESWHPRQPLIRLPSTINRSSGCAAAADGGNTDRSSCGLRLLDACVDLSSFLGSALMRQTPDTAHILGWSICLSCMGLSQPHTAAALRKGWHCWDISHLLHECTSLLYSSHSRIWTCPSFNCSTANTTRELTGLTTNGRYRVATYLSFETGHCLIVSTARALTRVHLLMLQAQPKQWLA